MTAVVVDPNLAAPSSSRPGRTARRRPLKPGTMVAALAAYVIALIFILPYIEMVISALRPPKELLSRGYEAGIIPHKPKVDFAA